VSGTAKKSRQPFLQGGFRGSPAAAPTPIPPDPAAIREFTQQHLSREANRSRYMATATKTKVKVRPLGDRVLVRRLEAAEEQVRGGIIIPDTAKEKPMEAEVVAIGDGKRLDDGSRAPFEVAVGDTVLMGKYAGTEIKFDNESFLILKEDEILGIVG